MSDNEVKRCRIRNFLKARWGQMINWMFNIRRSIAASIVLLSLLFLVLLFLLLYLDFSLLEDAQKQFDTSIIIAFYFGIFSICAYYVARKVEEYVRYPIRSYEQFVKESLELLQKDRGPFKIMIIYLDFTLDQRVALGGKKHRKGGKQLNTELEMFAIEARKDISILLPTTEVRKSFLADFKKMGEEEPKLPTIDVKKIDYILATDEADLKQNLYDRLPCKEYKGKRLPFQLFLSSETLVWIALKEPYPSRELKSTGFRSKDEGIRSTFETIFDNYWKDAAEF